MSLIEKIFDFLEKHLPGLMVAFGLGYKIAKKKNKEEKIKAAKLELENALLKNKESVRTRFDGMSDSDVVNSITSPGENDKPDT